MKLLARRAAVMRLALALVAVTAGAASAAPTPQAYIEARQSAAHHVQIVVIGVERPDGGMGECSVTGTVVRVFKGPLNRGDAVRFAVACHDWGQAWPSERLWTDTAALAGAGHVEAFLNGPAPAETAALRPRADAPVVLDVALDQVAIVPEARERPYCLDDVVTCEIEAAEGPGLFTRLWSTITGWFDW